MLADVDLRSEDGALPEEDLELLLEAKDGEPLDPADIQADLATLYRVGNFRAVEATVEPWPYQLPNGETIEVAHLTYRVYAAPEIVRVTIIGNKRFSDREIRDVIGLVDGQEFYLDLDGPPVEERLQTWLARQGYPEAEVEVKATSPVTDPDRQFVSVSVDEGIPDIVESIQFIVSGESPVSERKLRRWAKRVDLEEGRPLAAASLKDARELIKKRLGLVQRTPFRKARGLVEARVTTLAAGPVGLKEVTVSIEPGSRLVIEPHGIDRRAVRRALSIDPRVRLTAGFLDSAPGELEKYLQERGWYSAEVDVSLEEEPGVNRLVVNARLGPRHSIGPRLPFPHRLGSSHAGIEFDFDVTDLEERSTRLERDLQSLFFLASPDVLSRHHYTTEAMEAGRDKAETLLVKRGHLDAEITIEEPSIRQRKGLGVLLGRLIGRKPARRIRPSVRVTLGPVTRLGAFQVEGLAPEVGRRAAEYLSSALGREVRVPLSDEDAEQWAAVLLGRAPQERLVDGPYSPQEIEAIRELVVSAHQAEGYLEADARVSTTAIGEDARQAIILVDPGTKVKLRSIATQGRRRTKRRVIVNTIDLDPGDALRLSPSPTPVGDREAPRTLEDVRNDLYGLGAFEAVVLQAVGDEEYRDLLVRVSEQSRWRFEPGLGLSTDQGLRLLFNGTRENLFGLTHRLRAQLLGSVDLQGPQIDSLRTTFNPPELRASLDYTAPRFPLPSQDFVADLVLRDWRQERTWRLTRTGGGLRVLTNLGSRERTQVGVGVRLEYRGLSQVAPAIVLPGEPWELGDDGTYRPRFQGALTGQLVWDQRNDPLTPTKGILLSVNGELAPGLAFQRCAERANLFTCASEELRDQRRTRFVKAEARFSGFRRVSRSGLLLKTVGRLGYIRMLSPTGELDATVPGLEDRFRLGGTGSLRGFRRHGVGPHNRVEDLVVQSAPSLQPALGATLADRDNRWVPTGGDTLAVAGAELVVPLPALGLSAWDGYSLAAFVEVGNTWLLALPDDVPPPSSDTIESPSRAWRNVNPFLRWSFGIGGRRDSPIGPIQIDFALNPQRFGVGDTARFLRDQLREEWFRFHVTLGELF